MGRILARILPNGTTGLEAISYQYPLKLITPSNPTETKSALIFLLSYGGGLVGGDTVHLSIDVEADSKLSIVTQGHTKVFPSPTPDIVTRQTLDVRIAAGAALCLLPDPVQPFEASVYEQVQIFKLAAGANLCLLDWVTQGRTARGEDWSFVRWTGRNEVWTTGDGTAPERLLVRDSVILESRQAHAEMKSLRESMHSLGVFGTLVLRGQLMKKLGDFFLAEFDALPRLGARDWRSDEARARGEAMRDQMLPHDKWRAQRLAMESKTKLLWSAAKVRGCVVVKFGASEVEASREWLGAMLGYEGTILDVFGDHAMLCVK
ncbi:urease accessory protein UreD [Podospora conica]|nr:urease accessory protein UreD [Schizothecium conicum]